ncbi:SH3 domain-containing protein [Kutzneria sp. NPDC052558]|uniref:SH3 domain-containing protein n=1 Tax=Kutzneria sp. NPDC052558 TaxID=3364121 RepID=UPI0037CACA55
MNQTPGFDGIRRQTADADDDRTPRSTAPRPDRPATQLAQEITRVLPDQRGIQPALVDHQDDRPFGPPVRVPYAGRGVVQTPLGALRAGPDPDSALLTYIPQGARVAVTAKIGDFYEVNAGGLKGYVHSYSLAVATTASGEDPMDQVTVDKSNWLEVVPDATGAGMPIRAGARSAQGRFLQFGAAPGQLPTATYGRSVTAAPLASGVTASDVDSVVASIETARAGIRRRYLAPRRTSAYLGYEGSQNANTSLRNSPNEGSVTAFRAQDPNYQETVDATTSFVDWVNNATTKPSQCDSATDMRWLVFRRMMKWEGTPQAINAYDRTNVTYGAGFAGSAGGTSSGQFEELLGEVVNRSPEASLALAAAGITVVGRELVVVDPAKKWKLHGMDAELYLRANRELLSLLTNVAEGVYVRGSTPTAPNLDARQGVLDANFAVFLNHTANGIPTAELGTDVDLAALKVHCVHSGSFTWAGVRRFTTIRELVQHIYNSVSESWANVIVVEPEWRRMAH